MAEHPAWSSLEAGLALSPLPVWLLDLDVMRVAWANPQGLVMWQASSLEALRQRDMLADAPQKIHARLLHTISAVRAGHSLQEEWAFYPRGKQTMVMLHLCGVTLADGRLAMLNQAMPVAADSPPSLLRGITALRHVNIAIAFIDASGRIQMQNPAAMETFAESEHWFSWLDRPEAGGELLARALRLEPVQVDLQVATRAGRRFHAVELQAVRDPVSGEPSVLVQHIDITARITAEATAAERLRTVQAQHQEILLLSAPILDVGRHTIAVPVIGELNSERCQELAKRVLPALVERRARRAILDLTGVSGIDGAGVAGLRRLLDAVVLLGAAPIMTGIGAALAQRLADCGAALAQFQTRRSLAEAIVDLMANKGTPAGL
jgi:anti-anti-sigma regulatory factor/PAS domain-containing protein